MNKYRTKYEENNDVLTYVLFLCEFTSLILINELLECLSDEFLRVFNVLITRCSPNFVFVIEHSLNLRFVTARIRVSVSLKNNIDR
jgi:hypothetical protein